MVELRSRSQIDRRFVMSSIVSLGVLSSIDGRAFAAPNTDPPPFRTTRQQYTVLEPAKPFPDTTLTDLDGRTSRLSATPGTVALINVWASWCEACRLDLPLLDHFNKTSAGRVTVAAVSIDTDRQQVKNYLDELAIQTLPVYLDPDEKLAFAATGIPVTYLVTPEGRVAGYIQGVTDWLTGDAQRLLAYYASH